VLRGEAGQIARLAGSASRLIGRARDTDALLTMLRGTRLITVTGLPGVGKTAVTIAAATAAKDFPDGVWPVALGQLRDQALVPHTVAQYLSVPDYLSRTRLDSLAGELRSRRLLLILDTCEHLARGCADLAAALLRSCPQLRIITTSREPLRLPDERLLTIRPLALGHAISLFGQRAAEAAPAFQITPGNRATVTAVCRRLDRLPLAIELAARQLAAGSLDRLRADLEVGFGLLHNSADSPGRHQTLCAAIGWSHQLCTPAERLLWARLSVFTEPFGLPDAAAVCAGDNLSRLAVADALLGLASRSVLLTDPPPDPGAGGAASGARYRVPQTIRAYGAAMLLRLGEEAELHRRHQAWRAGQ
jgi:predicted ATPase